MTEPDETREILEAVTNTVEAIADRLDLIHAHVENLIERMHDLETWLFRTNPGYRRHVQTTPTTHGALPNDQTIDGGDRVLRRDPLVGCTCGWGGQHDPDNPRCARNADPNPADL